MRPGLINVHGQEIVRKGRKAEAQRKFARLYVMKCTKCDNHYGTLSCNVHKCLCPQCMDGKEGLPYE